MTAAAALLALAAPPTVLADAAAAALLALAALPPVLAEAAAATLLALAALPPVRTWMRHDELDIRSLPHSEGLRVSLPLPLVCTLATRSCDKSRHPSHCGHAHFCPPPSQAAPELPSPPSASAYLLYFLFSDKVMVDL